MGKEMAGLPAAVTAQNDFVLMPVMSVEQSKEQLKRLQEFVREVMVKGEDYGVVPGTDRPTLKKPGAEKLCELYGLAPAIKEIIRVEDWDRGFFHYEVIVQLISKRTGTLVAEGVGSANSKEAKYAARWVPEWKLRDQDVSGLPWREKANQHGSYREYRVSNEDPFTLVNTLLKMAKKRGLVDAVLSATRSSGLFTQDIEDMDPGLESDENPEAKGGSSPRRPQADQRDAKPRNQGNQPQGDLTRNIPQEAYELGQQVGWTVAKVKARYVSYLAAGKSLEDFMEDLKTQAARAKSA